MLQLIQTAPCQFDLAPDESAGDDSAAATLVYAALFTDQEAPLKRVETPWDRRGWFKDQQAGSGLWHVRRQPLNADARREAIALIERALTLKSRAAPALQDIHVHEVEPTEQAGNISRLCVEVTGLHNGRKFLVRVPLSD
jgi:phage gp46-like protein